MQDRIWRSINTPIPRSSSSTSHRRRWTSEVRKRDVTVVCISWDFLLAIPTFAVARLARRDGSSWKTITYRWLWIFRDSGSALFRSRECYGAEFSSVLFPLRHVAPFLPLSSPRGKWEKGTEKKRSEGRCRGEVPAATFLPVSRDTSETERLERKYKNQTERETLTFWHFQVWWDFPLSFHSSGVKFFRIL